MEAFLPALSVGFSADGERFLVGSFEQVIRIYSADGSRELGSIDGHRFGTRALLPTGDKMISAGLDGRVVAWDLDSMAGEEVVTW